MRGIVIIFFAVLSFVSEGRSVSKRTLERRSATCSANGRTYNSGATIVYHNITTPVENAMCTSCDCSAGSIGNCISYHCDVGRGMIIEACERWVKGVEGICCPYCECFSNGNQKNDGDSWIRRLSSGKCYECSCKGSHVDCSLSWCPPCDGVAVPVEGKCCPECQAATTQGPVFTVELTTTRSPPVFPPGFPWRDEEFDEDDE